MTIKADFSVVPFIYLGQECYIMEECRHTRQNKYLLIVALTCVILLSGLAIASDSPVIQRTTQQVGVISGNETSPSSFVPASFNTTSNPASVSESEGSRDSAAPLPLLILFVSAAALIFLVSLKPLRVTTIEI